MSIEALSHAWKHADCESTGDLLILLALADFADEDGLAWPKIKTLAKKARLSERQVQRGLRRLEDLGQIEVRAGGHIDGKNLPNTYRYMFKGVSGCRPPGDADVGTPPTPVSPPVEPSVEAPGEPGGDDGSPQLFAAPESSPSPAQSAPKDGITQEMVESVWAHYVERFSARLRIKGLTEARGRVIRKALKAVGAESDPDAALNICNAAIDGLQSYRTTKPGSTDISTIFETNMHSRSNLTDQIEWWAGNAQTTLPSRDATGGGSHEVPLDLSGVPSVTKGRIQSERRHVVKMIAHPSSADAQERGRKALDWLKSVVGHRPVMEDGALRGWEQA